MTVRENFVTMTRGAVWCVLSWAAYGCASDATVRLTVRSEDLDGRPATGAIAVFQDRSGATVADTMVDAAGRAEAELPGGGSVTVIRIDETTPAVRNIAITTIRGVASGDQLTIGATASPLHFIGGNSTMTAHFTPSFPGGSYTLATACGGVSQSTGSAIELPFNDSCRSTTFDLLSVATLNTDPPQVRYVYQTGLAYAAGGSVTVPGSWNIAGRFQATLTPAPDDLSTISLSHMTLLGRSPTAVFSGGVAQPAPGLVAVATPYLPGVGDGAIIVAGLHKLGGAGGQVLEVRTGLITASWTFDLRRIVPWVGTATATPTGASWEQTGDGAVDARLVTWRGSWSDGARTNHLAWTIEDGERTASLTLPALPEAYAAYDPARISGLTVEEPVVTYLDYDILDGYDEARPFGPNLTVALTDLGVLVDRALQRRMTIHALRAAATDGVTAR